MSLSRSVLRASAQAQATIAARPAARAAPLATIARSSYRQYSSGSGSSSGSKKNKIPAATVSLLGLGSVGAYFGLSKEQDPATTQEGMRKPGSEVDYQQVGCTQLIRCSAPGTDVCLPFPLSCDWLCPSVRPS